MIILPTRNEILELIWSRPVEIGHWVGFGDLTDLHNDWLRAFLFSDDDFTLQAHRGSFKTTDLSLFFALHAVIYPNETLIYLRKSDADVREITRQTRNILASGCMAEITRILYGQPLQIVKDAGNEISTNLPTNIKGASQIVGLGIGSSITGKHADIVVTDDIVNLKDRASEAERNRVKLAYQELQNIKNRGGRMVNTGTPWHKDDAFTLMPNIHKFDCYSTGLMTEDQIAELRLRMSPSLFAANYELKHIADEELIFGPPVTGGSLSAIVDGTAHVDSAFYGEDFTAFSVMAEHDGKFYLFGRVWRKSVDDCYGDIVALYKQFRCRRLHMETNADKGMVAKELKKLGVAVSTYHEEMNKHVKIVTYLKAIWPDVVIVNGTDDKYLEQICDYNENAEHDDAPDSAACLARIAIKGKNKIGLLDKRALGL